MENVFSTALTGQSTYEDLVKKFSLRRILFDKSCLRLILFHEKSGMRCILFIRNPLLKVAKGIVQPKFINDGRSFAECYVGLF